MPEIILLYGITKMLDLLSRRKGVYNSRYKLYALIIWLACEITGASIGAILFGSDIYKVYFSALVGGALGIIVSFFIVQRLISIDSTLPAPLDNRYGKLSD